MVNSFLSEHWVVFYGLIMFGIGTIYGYLHGRREKS